MFIKYHKFRNGVRKSVVIGDSVAVEFNGKVVGLGKLNNESCGCRDYDIAVAECCVCGGNSIAEHIKCLIRQRDRYSGNLPVKRRRFFVETVDNEVIPVRINLIFSKI